jgi:GNAT superfamily N-acetyltransferase
VNELERVEAQAVRDAVVAGGGRAETAGGAVCFMHPRVPMPELNRAIPVGAVVDVHAILAWFDGRGHSVCVPPGYLGLEEQLGALAYEPAGSWMKFRRADEPAPDAATTLRIEQTRDAEAFSVASGTPPELSGFVGGPGWLHFVAWDEDDPVASGALYADGEDGWVGVGATREEWRGRGAQSSLLAARIEAGRRLGVRRFATETGEEQDSSYRNILRAGFHEAYLRANWRSPA